MDGRLSLTGFGGLKSDALVVKVHDHKHALSLLEYLILVSFNALYAWEQDPMYSNSGFAMDWGL